MQHPDKNGFSSVSNVRNVVENMRKADLTRGSDRALVASCADGDPPYTDQEAEDFNIETNANFLELARVTHAARGQYNGAYLTPSAYFHVTIDLPEVQMRQTIESRVNRHLKTVTKKNPDFVSFVRSSSANVVLHGISPALWPNPHSWVPEVMSLSDVLVPTRTLVDMRNLAHFAIRRIWTPHELYRMAMRRKTDPGWNMRAVNALFKTLMKHVYAGESANTQEFHWDRPEETQKLIKENSLYYSSDAVPHATCWDFFYQEPEDDGKWHRKILVDEHDKHFGKIEELQGCFLYDSKRAYAPDWRQIAHWEFGDLSNSAPQRYHHVRGLGWLLYSVMELMNRMRCRFTDAVFQELLWFFWSTNMADIDRVNRVNLHHLGVLPDGLKMLNRDERYTPDHNLVNNWMSQGKQLIQESSQSFTQDVDTGTRKEMTATESMSRTATAQALVGAVLNMSFTQRQFLYEEICRRFCRKGSRDKDVQRFWELCRRDEIPEEALNFERWEITVESNIGQGNKQMQLVQTNQLMSVRAALDPQAQRVVLHRFVLANTDDGRLADQLVPLDREITPSEDHIFGQVVAGTLLRGVEVAIPNNVVRQDYVVGALGALFGEVQKLSQSGIEREEQAQGLQLCWQHIAENVALIAQDPQMKELAAQLQDTLMKLRNMITQLITRFQQEQQQAQQQGGNGQPDPKVLAAQQKMQMDAQKHSQEMQMDQQGFELEQRRKDAELAGKLRRDNAQFQLTAAQQDAKTARDIAQE